MILPENVKHLVYRLRERLWFWPAVACLMSVFSVYAVKFADRFNSSYKFPEIALDSIEALLTIMATSMLTVAALAVTTMVSAYSSAGNTATPRSFSLVVADSVAQRSLSIFIGAFIFSVISLISVKNSFFDVAGKFSLFVITLSVLALVIVTFVYWVDHMARLGRLGTIIQKVEMATAAALDASNFSCTHDARDFEAFSSDRVIAIGSPQIGYLQRIDLPKLQSLANDHDLTICIEGLSGTFVAPNMALGRVVMAADGVTAGQADDLDQSLVEQLQKCFIVGTERTFEADPRFGFITLSETASRALSPAVNDPGTAIVIIGTIVRLLGNWEIDSEEESGDPKFDLIYAPRLAMEDIIEDAFGAMSRDGANRVEIGVRLQKALKSLVDLEDRDLSEAVKGFAEEALKRSLDELRDDADKALVESVAR